MLEPNDEEEGEEKLKIVNLITIEDINEDQMRNETLQEQKNILIKKGEVYYKKCNRKEKILLSEK